MEKFYKLLSNYNQLNNFRYNLPSWALKYTGTTIPFHLFMLNGILDVLPKSLSCLEVGCGGGDILALLAYKGFNTINGYEMDYQLCSIAQEKLSVLFHRRNVVIPQKFSCENYLTADILIQINCVYSEDCKTKDEYLNKIKNFYKYAGYPSIYVYEAIDAKYMTSDVIFPQITWLYPTDIQKIFPNCKITSFISRYQLHKSVFKRIYIIKKA